MNSTINSELKYQLHPVKFIHSENFEDEFLIQILNKGVIIESHTYDMQTIKSKILDKFTAFQENFFKKYVNEDKIIISYKLKSYKCMGLCQPYYNFIAIITRFNKIYSKKSISENYKANYKLDIFSVSKIGMYAESYTALDTYYSVI